MATQIILKDNIYVHNNNGYYSIKAKNNIKSGTIVLIEHVIAHRDIAMIHNTLVHCDKLREDLCPRKNECPTTKELITKKIRENMFVFSNNLCVLGDMCSKFNHSCNPNCFITCVDSIQDKNSEYCCEFYGIYVIKKIKKGEELFLDYSNGHKSHHEKYSKYFGLVCDCTDHDKRLKRSNIQFDIVQSYIKKDKKFITQITDEYISSFNFQEIKNNHDLSINIMNQINKYHI